MTNKVYLVDEVVLRQVLDALETWGDTINYQYSSTRPAMNHLMNSDDKGFDAIEALSTILASEPQEPVATVDCGILNWIADKQMQYGDLYRKDL